ncbi:hypothetical protein ME763_37610 (plasmid) [Streptomyces murinus]|uniref:hypothetical protein n=1 Tax=Streptomyces murinus TaxID=33900 RepID=UPI001180A251|nr:hypothetical protein [Streptomyces murinus]WDO11239.1 hypothetical protein ME763_37610 [Streptomyces murinus]
MSRDEERGVLGEIAMGCDLEGQGKLMDVPALEKVDVLLRSKVDAVLVRAEPEVGHRSSPC